MTDMEVMSNPYTGALDVLRRQRTRLDETIAHLEELSGATRALPATQPPTAYVAVPEVPQRKALPPARVKKPRRKKHFLPRPPATSWKAKQAAVESIGARVGTVTPSRSGDDTAVLDAVRALGAATRDQVISRTRLPIRRVQDARVRLVASGAIVVKGWARGARWSLPATKEAP